MLSAKTFKETTLIIPTLNEAENLPILFKIVEKLYPDINIIISDGGSTDGTQKIVKEKNKENKRITLLDNSKKSIHGLCTNVIEAVFKTNTKYIVVMDADLQHPPEKIKNITESLNQDYDIVIGRRKKIKQWSFLRKLISKFATLLGKISLFLRRKKIPGDLLSGFFGAKTELFQKVIKENYQKFELRGYKVLFDLLKFLPRNIKIKEVDYVFKGRQYGESKIKLKHIIYFLKSLFK